MELLSLEVQEGNSKTMESFTNVWFMVSGSILGSSESKLIRYVFSFFNTFKSRQEYMSEWRHKQLHQILYTDFIYCGEP